MDDLEFVQGCIKGDKQSWDAFVDRYSRLIYNYIHSVLKIKGTHFSQGNINDIFQEIFLSLSQDGFRKLKTYKAKNGCSLASWLRQVTVNFTIDYLRKKRTLLSLDEELGEDFSLKDTLADNSPQIPEALNQKERLTQLQDCISKLSDNDKYFLQLHINQGLRLEELKEILGLSRGAIDMQKSRIIERLRECFKSKGFALDF